MLSRWPGGAWVKHGLRFVHGGEKELVGKLGHEDRCPCGSGNRFHAALPGIGPVSTVPDRRITGDEVVVATGDSRLTPQYKSQP